MDRKHLIAGAFVLAVVFALAVFGSVQLTREDVGSQAARSRFTHVVTKRLTVENAADFQDNVTVGNGTPSITQDGEDLYVEGQLEVDGEAQFDGAIDGNSSMALAGDAVFDADFSVDDTFNVDDTAYALVGSQTLTPTASFYTLAPVASVLTLTLGTAAPNAPSAGDFVWFVSTVTTNTVFADTGATAGGGTRTLGENDVIGFIFNGSAWIEAFFSDNS